MKNIKEYVSRLKIVRIGKLYDNCGITAVNVSNWMNAEASGKPLHANAPEVLNAIQSKIQALYNVFLELSENPSLDRQAELLEQSKSYLHVKKILKILNDDGSQRNFESYLSTLDELDTYLTKKIKVLNSERVPLQAKQENLSVVFKEEQEEKPDEKIEKQKEQTILGDPFDKRVSEFLKNGLVVKS